jgi:hypothetical protein
MSVEQGFGSGSELDPDSIRHWIRIRILEGKNYEISFMFQVLDVLF